MDPDTSNYFPRGAERKLSPAEEAELSRRYRAREAKPKALREQYGICKATLYNILARNPAEPVAPSSHGA